MVFCDDFSGLSLGWVLKGALEETIYNSKSKLQWSETWYWSDLNQLVSPNKLFEIILLQFQNFDYPSTAKRSIKLCVNLISQLYNCCYMSFNYLRLMSHKLCVLKGYWFLSIFGWKVLKFQFRKAFYYFFWEIYNSPSEFSYLFLNNWQILEINVPPALWKKNFSSKNIHHQELFNASKRSL